MKNILLVVFILSMLLMGCVREDNSSTALVPRDGEPEIGVNCTTLCYQKIPQLCDDFIREIDSYPDDIRARYSESYVYNKTYCDDLCGSWTEEIMNCVNDATSCEQIKGDDGTCETTPKMDPFEYPDEIEVPAGCERACRNYADCAGLAAGATAGDLMEAYSSCYSECHKWSAVTIECMSNANGKTPMGCATISQCGVREYQSIIHQFNSMVN